MIKITSHIEVHACNSHLFIQLCEETDADCRHLLLHTEVRWLFKGRSLARVFLVMRFAPEIFLFLEKVMIGNTQWSTKLACLFDIFNLVHELNLSLLGRLTTVFMLVDKVAAFKTKLEL